MRRRSIRWGLAAACLSLMQDGGLPQHSVAAARLSADTFVWENESRKYVDACDRSLATLSAGAVEPAGPSGTAKARGDRVRGLRSGLGSSDAARF
jgi:hypothetical protein